MANVPTSQQQVAREGRGDNAAIARAYFDAFNKRDFDGVARIVADDCEILNIPLGHTFRGVAGQREYAESWVRAYPDATLEVINVISQGDLCVVEMLGRGTHKGPISLPDGKEIAATNKVSENRFCDVLQLRDGKIVRERLYYDMATTLRNLGLMG